MISGSPGMGISFSGFFPGCIQLSESPFVLSVFGQFADAGFPFTFREESHPDPLVNSLHQFVQFVIGQLRSLPCFPKEAGSLLSIHPNSA